MLFSSLTFLYFFLPAVVIFYFVSKNRKWRNGVLLAFSLLFYSWGEPKYVLLILSSTVLAWIFGLGIDKNRNNGKGILSAAVVILLANLAVFKYLNFISDNICTLFNVENRIKEIALPIGISFYTFQILSYLIDLYRGKVDVQRNFFRLALYVCFFPQLIAGPIVRYETIENEISGRSENWDDIVIGARRFILGLSKKVIIANNVAVVVEAIYSSPQSCGTAALWVAAFCYSLQIYFDFSGYSDMAIGLGRIFGFHFLENFNYPYCAISITDFWKRWHISLSSWFRDYVYIPLGGNRVGTGRRILNILIVWTLTGIWHGANWNFILWGLFYGILLVIEKYCLDGAIKKTPMLIRRIITLLIIMVGWTIFYHTDLKLLGDVLKQMFIFTPTDWNGLLLSDTSVCFKLCMVIPAALLSFPIFKTVKLNTEKAGISVLVNVLYLGMLAFSVILIISSSFNPFIYFRF